MIENILLQLLIISLYTNIVLSVFTFVLLIVLTIKFYKENHTSACH